MVLRIFRNASNVYYTLDDVVWHEVSTTFFSVQRTVVNARSDLIIREAWADKKRRVAPAYHHVISRIENRDRHWNAPNIEILTSDYFSRLIGYRDRSIRADRRLASVRGSKQRLFIEIFIYVFCIYLQNRWQSEKKRKRENRRYNLSCDLFV